MSEVKSGVSLEDLEIMDIRIRKTQTGDLLIEIPGDSSVPKQADKLERLNSLFQRRREERKLK